MGGVAGRVGDLEVATQQPLPARQHRQVVLGHGLHLAPQAVHVIAVQPAWRSRSAADGSTMCAAPRSWTYTSRLRPALRPASRWRRRDRGGCGSAAAPADADRRAPPAAPAGTSAGPGSISTSPTWQQRDHARATEMHEVDHAHDGGRTVERLSGRTAIGGLARPARITPVASIVGDPARRAPVAHRRTPASAVGDGRRVVGVRRDRPSPASGRRVASMASRPHRGSRRATGGERARPRRRRLVARPVSVGRRALAARPASALLVVGHPRRRRGGARVRGRAGDERGVVVRLSSSIGPVGLRRRRGSARRPSRPGPAAGRRDPRRRRRSAGARSRSGRCRHRDR